MANDNRTSLVGMKEITEYCKYSYSVVKQLIKEKGFPAVKLNGKIWESDKKLIDEWRLKIISKYE